MSVSDVRARLVLEPNSRGPKGVRRAWRSVVCSLTCVGVWGMTLGAFPSLGNAEEEAGKGATSLKSQIEERLSEMPSGEEGVNRILSELDARLSLSAEQEKEIREVVARGVAELEALRARFKAGELTAMALGVQVQMKMQKMAVLIEPLLNPEQEKEYAAMRQEQRREMMQAMRKQRMEAAGTK